jgi:hypothetical protein
MCFAIGDRNGLLCLIDTFLTDFGGRIWPKNDHGPLGEIAFGTITDGTDEIGLRHFENLIAEVTSRSRGGCGLHTDRRIRPPCPWPPSGR